MNRATNTIPTRVLALLGTSPDPAILSLAYLPYLRELVPMEVGGLLRLKLDKRGWRLYKRRCPYPQGDPPPANINGILRAFRSAGLPAVRGTDEGNFVFIYFEKTEGV